MAQKVCLIIPPSAFLLDERVFMPLGILRIAAVLENAGWCVEVLDLSGYSNFQEAAADYAHTTNASCFAITATTAQLPAAAEIATTVRSTRPDVRLILGGPHVTLVHAARKQEVKKNFNGRAYKALAHLERIFDVLVAGDGEEAIFVACGDNPPFIIDADGRESALFLTKRQVEELPFPARHLVDVSSYRYSIDGVPALSLIAQLGCPFNCGFCAGRRSPMLRHIRTRSSENIVAEMRELYLTYGHRGFMFYDDELNVNTSLVDLLNLITEAQQELNVEWRLRGFIKAELFTEEQAAAMYRAGFRWVLVGFESGSPRILDNINKRAMQEDNTRCLQIAKKYGLKVKALMSLGHPGESADTAEETLTWLLAAQPEDFDISIITPYPGSPYYDDAEPTEKEGVWVYRCKNGDELYQHDIDYTTVADYYKGDPDDGYVAHVFTKHLTEEELVHQRDRLERLVRKELDIPFNNALASVQYEHSMGQTSLPNRMLRKTQTLAPQ